jgi:ATP-dependent Clp protease ATP-binding subunit ClpC
VAEALIPFTDESKKVLERALRQSLEGGQRQIGAENILLSVLAEPRGEALRLLTGFGIDVERLRGQLEQRPPLRRRRPRDTSS